MGKVKTKEQYSGKRRLKQGSQAVVVLVHGLAVTPASMATLEKFFRKRGFTTENWGYPSLTRRIEANGSRLAKRLKELDNDDRFDVIHLVTHSMGGIVARCALLEREPRKLERVVMIAPPNRGSAIAAPIAKLGGVIAPPVRQLLGFSLSFVNTLSTDVSAEIGMIAGANDLVVSPRDTYLNRKAKYKVVQGGHVSVLRDRHVAKQALEFLKTGEFFNDTPSIGSRQNRTVTRVPLTHRQKSRRLGGEKKAITPAKSSCHAKTDDSAIALQC